MTSSAARDHLLARLERAGASIHPADVDALEQYFTLLARWNPTINLTALPLNPPSDETFDRLIVEAIVAARHIEAAASDAGPIRWMDLGSGGGSPAIPLKIVRPTWSLTMVEAKERKASFLREAIRMLRLQGADVANGRFEDLGREGTADVVTVRAVKVDRPFADVVRRLLTPQGVLAVFSSTAVMLDGFESEHSRALIPDASAVLTLLRVPRGT